MNEKGVERIKRAADAALFARAEVDRLYHLATEAWQELQKAKHKENLARRRLASALMEESEGGERTEEPREDLFVVTAPERSTYAAFFKGGVLLVAFGGKELGSVVALEADGSGLWVSR